ncbi:uncharacterized protein LOC122198757 isoform X4 [Panthera leo]|uniref:uncharacterized protein LOC122198757 isoform X4 n=1 Tax=Panthera leo TaxID=9689 RepID=UPI001C6A7990|nr:uncharacterized protein LOC122198757 isoform X4 [Panthera leo]
MWVNITCNPGTYINERGVRSRRTHIKQQWLRQSNRIREFQEYSIVIQHSYTLLSAYRVSFYMRSQRRSCWCGSYIYVSSPVSSLQMKHHNLGYASKEYRTRVSSTGSKYRNIIWLPCPWRLPWLAVITIYLSRYFITD